MPEPIPQTDAPQVAGLGHRVAGGFAWLLTKTFAVKAIGIISQIALAWFLLKEDFGLIGLAYSVTVFVAVLNSGGLKDVLVQKTGPLQEFLTAATWISLLTGLLAAGIIAGMAPIAAHLYNDQRLIGLLLLLACVAPITALRVVPVAILQRELRFRAMAVIGFVAECIRQGVAVLLAYLDYGAYSFVWAQVASATFFLVAYWAVTRPPIGWHPHWRLWGQLIGPGSMLTVASVFMALNAQGGNIALGIFHDAAVVGLFFFAYSLSAQILQVLAQNLSSVLMPSFSKLQAEPARQLRAFVRASSTLAMIGAPASLLLAATAEPLIHALFTERWRPAVPVLQLLSVGMALNITSIASTTFMVACGRFKAQTITWAVGSLSFFALAFVAASFGGAVMVAAATGLYMALFGPATTYVALRLMGEGWRQVWRICAPSFIAGVIACGIPMALGYLVADLPAGDWLQLVGIPLLAAVIYIALIRRMAAEPWAELTGQLRAMLSRRRGGSAPQPAADPGVQAQESA